MEKLTFMKSVIRFDQHYYKRPYLYYLGLGCETRIYTATER